MDDNTKYIDLITSEHYNKPKYKAYVKKFLDMLSPAVNCYNEYNILFVLDTAVGSQLDIIAAQQSSRGKRATGGLMEECILIDQTLLNEVIIPTMNVDRRLADGSRQEDEPVNKSQIYVTTAG